MEKKMEATFPPVTDLRSGFNPASRTFHSLKSPLLLPPPNAAISAASYVLFLRRNSHFPDSSTAVVDSANGHTLSYGELIHRAENLAANLATVLKLSKAHTALVLSPNIIQVPILCFALLSLGVVVSPANPLSTRSEITRLFHLSKPAIVFAVTSNAETTREFHVRTVLLDSPEFDSLTRTKIQPLSPTASPTPVTQSDVAAILYSSGTTGKMKGVMLTHRNLTAVAAGYDTVRTKRAEPAVYLYTVPYFHVYGFTFSLGAMVLSDTVVIMERFSFRGMLSAAERFRVTHITVVPALVVAMTKDKVIDGYNLTSLEGIVCGGAPLRKETDEAFKAKFPKVLVMQGYGLTESVVTRTTPEEANHVGTVGRLKPDIEAKVVNPQTGKLMFPGEKGELWIKGPYVMKGYVDDPEATSATLVNGWLRTGDLCYFDNDGFLYIVDRLKELIKYKGYQVAPAELEELLLSHPDILDAAVIPYPDNEAGEVPMAFVVRQPQSSLGVAQVIDFVAKQVTPYKKVRRVAFVDSIPKNASGKILRKDLRKVALSKL
ncbi:4-coumarate--CoA ligase-like 9 [Vigna radiata var. radiata]|uniref:4-coumarate--CoA ligase-like 9 n=1 Tax=Vigna radiata var. radiata TaxID=3916 RepID=A0A1S3UQZ3_VIGRR|nr:4-coumarate--CoA ligase-like 9 [Vigna radiata var. radiata]